MSEEGKDGNCSDRREPAGRQVRRETPAMTAVTRTLPGGGTQTIYTCPGHVASTRAQLGGGDVTVVGA